MMGKIIAIVAVAALALWLLLKPKVKAVALPPELLLKPKVKAVALPPEPEFPLATPVEPVSPKTAAQLAQTQAIADALAKGWISPATAVALDAPKITPEVAKILSETQTTGTLWGRPPPAGYASWELAIAAGIKAPTGFAAEPDRWVPEPEFPLTILEEGPTEAAIAAWGETPAMEAAAVVAEMEAAIAAFEEALAEKGYWEE